MIVPRSLTSRLVVTTVALVLLVSVLIGVATTLAMRSYLDDQLDQQVHQVLSLPPGGGPGYASVNLPFQISKSVADVRYGLASAGGILAVILANIVAIFLMRAVGKNLDK